MRHVHSLLTLGTLTLATTAACDSQMSPSYTGESLLTITGRVEISAERRDSLVIPALAFTIPERGDVRIRELEVQGQFPSDFRLDVYEPPSREAFFNGTYQKSGEPRMALAYITAVSSDHPDTIRAATETSVTYLGCSTDACDDTCAAPGCPTLRWEYCVADDPSLPCYSEVQYCPTLDAPPELCTTRAEGDGDPSLKESPWRTFAGFSQNYVVVYLETRAPASSVTAALLGSTKDVPPGYGLYATRAASEAEVAANADCTAEAEVRGVTGFNREYGTNLTTLNFDAYCGPMDMDAPFTGFRAPFCGSDIDEQDKLDAALAARERYIERAKRDLDCSLNDLIVERVASPQTESISVIVGQNVEPALWLH